MLLTKSSKSPASIAKSNKQWVDEGLHIGLGSDIAGGTSVSILRAMADAIQVPKLYWRLVDSSMKPLTGNRLRRLKNVDL